jgi:hypothetical protein
MYWDDLMRRWRRGRRGLSPGALRAAAGNVAVLPVPTQRRRSRWPWLVLLAVALAAIALLLPGNTASAIVAAIAGFR